MTFRAIKSNPVLECLISLEIRLVETCALWSGSHRWPVQFYWNRSVFTGKIYKWWITLYMYFIIYRLSVYIWPLMQLKSRSFSFLRTFDHGWHWKVKSRSSSLQWAVLYMQVMSGIYLKCVCVGSPMAFQFITWFHMNLYTYR